MGAPRPYSAMGATSCHASVIEIARTFSHAKQEAVQSKDLVDRWFA